MVSRGMWGHTPPICPSQNCGNPIACYETPRRLWLASKQMARCYACPYVAGGICYRHAHSAHFHFYRHDALEWGSSRTSGTAKQYTVKRHPKQHHAWQWPARGTGPRAEDPDQPAHGLGPRTSQPTTVRPARRGGPPARTAGPGAAPPLAGSQANGQMLCLSIRRRRYLLSSCS